MLTSAYQCGLLTSGHSSTEIITEKAIKFSRVSMLSLTSSTLTTTLP